MPCNSDYLEQNAREKELQRAAKLYVYVLGQMGQLAPERARLAAGDYYCKDEQPLLDLCALLKHQTQENLERLIYGNPRDKTARDLADWWEDHQKADREREERETSAEHAITVRLEFSKKVNKEQARMVVEEMLTTMIGQYQKMLSLHNLGTYKLDDHQLLGARLMTQTNFKVENVDD